LPAAAWRPPAGSRELLANVVVAAVASGAALALASPGRPGEAAPAGDPLWDEA
jgi:hypothetical protein